MCVTRAGGQVALVEKKLGDEWEVPVKAAAMPAQPTKIMMGMVYCQVVPLMPEAPEVGAFQNWSLDHKQASL
jgi:hypothetical protein